MNAKALAQVLLRVWGIALVVWGLSSLGNLFLFFVPVQPGSASLRASGAAAALHIIVYFIAGITFVRHGDRIGGWLVSDIDATPSPPASATEIESVGVAILGLYFLVTGIREFAAVAGALIANQVWAEPAALTLLWTRQREIAIAALVNVSAGALLLFGRKNIAAGLSKAWDTLRSRNSSPPDGSEDL